MAEDHLAFASLLAVFCFVLSPVAGDHIPLPFDTM